MPFETKGAARTWVWDALEEAGAARFPFPPHGRIPNFDGAKAAADRLLEQGVIQGADRVKVNPDAPQRYVRERLLAHGVEVYVPTPRLRGGFSRLDPASIPAKRYDKAAALSTMDEWAQPVRLDDLAAMDAIVTGSVAVSRDGHRAGKGEGFSDLEYAILQELGHGECPVATTVHPLQIVDGLPHDATDLPLALIVTPENAVEVEVPPPAPDGIDWDLLGEARIEAMPVLAQLRRGRG